MSLDGRRIAEVLATSTGGVGTHLRGLVPRLVADGARVDVLGPQSTEDLFGFTAGGAHFAAVDLAATGKLRSATRDADVIHAHGLRAATVAAAANSGRATPLIVTLHNLAPTGNPVMRRIYPILERFVARSADLVIGASPDLVERALDLGARRVIFGPVGAPPLPEPSRTRDEVRSELGVGDSAVLLSVGRLHPQKGYDTLLSAAGSWRGRAVSLIAGDGPLRDELQSRIDREDLPVRLLGRRQDVSGLLAAADAVLLPSVWEARSLVAQEAMRAGVPLVCTPTGGMAGLVGDAALTVPVGDADALARAVDQLLGDATLRAALAADGKARAAGFPTEADTAATLIRRYDELASGVIPS